MDVALWNVLKKKKEKTVPHVKRGRSCLTAGGVAFLACPERLPVSDECVPSINPISNQVGPPAEFKHIIKRRKRN